MLTYTQTQHLKFISISSPPSLYHKHESHAYYISATAEKQDIFNAVAVKINRNVSPVLRVFMHSKKNIFHTLLGIYNQPLIAQIRNTKL